MVIKDLELKDFLTFEKLKLKFDNKAKAIQGENHDDDDQEANGSGKSSIFYAIEFLLFSSTSKGGIDADLIRWGAKRAHLNMGIYCPVRGVTLEIERNINSTPKLALSIVDSVGESTPLDFSTVADGNKELLNWLSMTKEDIQNYYLISSAKYTSFMTSSNTNKLAMISRISNLSSLDSIDEVMLSKVKSKEGDIRSTQDLLIKADTTLSNLIESISEEEDRDLAMELEESKSKVKDSINKLEFNKYNTNKKIKSNEDLIEQNSNEITEIEKLVSNCKVKKDSFEINDFTKEIEEFNESIRVREIHRRQINFKIGENVNSIEEASEWLGSVRALVNGSVECPKCTHKFNPSDNEADIASEALKVDQIKGIIEGFKSANNKLRLSLSDNDNTLSGIENSKSKLVKISVKQDEDLRKLDKSLVRLSNSITTLSSRNDDLRASNSSLYESVGNIHEQILMLNKQLSDIKMSSIDISRIESLKVKVEASKDDIDELTTLEIEKSEELRKLKQWHFNLTKFSSGLARESLVAITNRQNRILKDMKSELRVRWEGFKMKKDGSLSDKIAPLIVRNGNEKPFKAYSGGERGRVEYSSILASQDLINSTHKYGGLDFLFTDEVVEGVDALGLMNIVNSLNKLNKPILMTTHVVNQSVSSDVMTVVKRGGISTIR